MNIWYLSKYASPPGATGGTRGLSLCREFSRLGHQAVIINSTSNHGFSQPWIPADQKIGRFQHRDFGGTSMWTHQTISYTKTASVRRILSWMDFELGLLRLPKQILPKPTHVIASSLSLLTFLTGYILAKKFRAHFIVEIRDIWPLTMISETRFSASSPLVKVLAWVEKFGYEKADLIVGTMPNLVEHVKATTLNHGDVVSIGLGIDPDLKRWMHIPRQKKKSKRFIVGYAGSFGRSNHLDPLLRMANSLKDDDKIEFRFYGKGDLLDFYQKTNAGQTNLAFLGQISREDLYEELSSCDLLVFSSSDGPEWKYGQSLNKVVEYMALGKPILGLYSGFPSMINEASCGFLVPSSETQLLTDTLQKIRKLSPQARFEMGLRGKEWLEINRSYPRLASTYMSALKNL